MMEDLKEKIRVSFEEFCEARTEEEKKLNDAKFKDLLNTVPNEQKRLAGQYLREVMRERKGHKSQKIDRNIKKELEDIQEIVSLSYIAKEYFGKDRTWLYKKINGSLTFTEDELKILAIALKNIGDKFLDTSASIA